jgi:hypothetical protein
MIMMQQTCGVLLSSAFHSHAELHGTLEDVRKALANIPGIRLASTGTRIRYAILNPENRNKAEAIAEFATNCVTFRFFFKTPSAYESKRNFLRFVAILAYLKDFYTIKLSDLYCYMVDALQQEQDAMLPTSGNAADDFAKMRMHALGSVNMSLSHKLLLADERLKETDRCISSYKKFCKEFIDGLIRRNGKGSSNTADVLCAFGFDKALADEISILVAGKTTIPTSDFYDRKF